MAVERMAVRHICSQILGKWLPPLLPEEALAEAFIPSGDWLQRDFWYDQCAKEVVGDADHWEKLATAAAEHFKALATAGAWYVPYWSYDYPALLRVIPKPPLGLSVLGDKKWLSQPGVAVVGSRKASASALYQSAAVGKCLAQNGTVVVSGGALGCDVAAHWGVLGAASCELPAVVVFAGGLETLYPKRNHAIFQRLNRGGSAFVSERLWGAPSLPYDFPIRNRIISGMTPYTVVMQAGARSGAYVTARWALEQGRDVFVWMHAEDDIRAAGSRTLLEDGARGFLQPSELLSLARIR